MTRDLPSGMFVGSAPGRFPRPASTVLADIVVLGGAERRA
jgi:hypothetical protein